MNCLHLLLSDLWRVGRRTGARRGAARPSPRTGGSVGRALLPLPPQTGPLRIGWQETWATQGQLAVILKQSKILNGWGLRPIVGFSYGAPLNEGALAGEVDASSRSTNPPLRSATGTTRGA